MKSIKSFIFLSLIVVFVYPVFAQTTWITDNEMQFKIEVPSNYKQNQFIEGADKILAVVSPDENVAVRVRAMKATQQFSADILQQVFEQNILNGAKQIAKEDGDLNGIPARAVAYTWKYNNIETVVGAYYIIQNGFAYVLWSIVPQSLLQQRSAEADAITNSFSLLSAKTGGLLSGVGTAAVAQSVAPGYVALVSDDACLEHWIPEGFKVTSQQEGQLVFENAAGIKMIQQTIFKQSDFRSFMTETIKGISEQGADIVKKQYSTINGLDVLVYAYTYNGTYFAYWATENNGIYYLLGFVGSTLKQSQLVTYSNTVVKSLKKADCGNN